MQENYKRMKAIAAQGQKKRKEPLRAKFIPGVTKNERYAHIQSKVGQFVKGETRAQGSLSDELGSRRVGVGGERRFILGGGGGGGMGLNGLLS